MINKRYRLVDTQEFRIDFVEEDFNNETVVVKPTYMAICAADQRYYSGNRPIHILRKKLPMALIHEAVGEVLYDSKNEYPVGTKVVLIPTIPQEEDTIVRENYRKSSRFCSSGYDGFMQESVWMPRTRILPIGNIHPRAAVFSEILSVAANATTTLQKLSHSRRKAIGIWGDGSLAFATALVVKALLPESKLYIVGKRTDKLSYFSFADETLSVDQLSEHFKVDHAFECVGGNNSSDAINNIIEKINPEGVIALMGVSEQYVPINTRDILEKGLTLVGNSRSSIDDFKTVLELLKNNPSLQTYIQNIISEEVVVNDIPDMHQAFKLDNDNNFKTIMKWNI